MSTEPTFAETAKQHAVSLVAPFTGMHAHCACGWVSDNAASTHEALADHAAHVHLAAGLATEEST